MTKIQRTKQIEHLKALHNKLLVDFPEGSKKVYFEVLPRAKSMDELSFWKAITNVNAMIDAELKLEAELEAEN